MEKSIRVHILGREYPLRVRPQDEELTREIATYVNEKMRAFKQAHPEQPDLVVAVFVSMMLAEELHAARDQATRQIRDLETTLNALDAELARALSPPPSNGQAATTQGEEDG